VRRHPFLFALALAALLAILLLAFAYRSATAEPVVRRTSVALPDWGEGEPGIRAVLLSDVHVGGPDMPPERLARIVEQVNALSPDIVLIAGDLITDKRAATRWYSMAEAIAPMAAFRTRLGAFAVLGNHDHWRNADQARAALKRAGVRLLENEAVRVGPLALGGLDDDFTGRARVAATVPALRALPGAKMVLSHSPDPFPELPADVQLMVAGHTHCGQIAFPIVGPLSTMSRYGKRYACGIVREEGKTLIVTAGLGTSGLPLRLIAVPDMWLIELGPKPAGAR
jgi:hypothetical protein